MTTPRSRAAIGVVTLVLAAGLLIAAPRLMPDQVVGTAESDWPAPPAVGACLTMPERGELSVVPCDRPHDAEVTRSWAATDPALNASPSSWMDQACAGAASEYIGSVVATDDHGRPGDSDWQPVGLAYQAFDIGAPESERAGSRGWRACIIRPTVPVRYTGIVRDAAPRELDQSTVPEAYRTCLDDRGNAQNCTLPHPMEVLALGTEILDAPIEDSSIGLEQLSTVPGSPPAEPGDTDPDAEARAQAEAARQWALESAILSNSDLLFDAQESLEAQCREVASRLVPALVSADAEVAVGLSRSTVALESSAYSWSGGVSLQPDGPTDVQPPFLAMRDTNGFGSLTAACVVTAPEGQQFTHSLLGWQGGDLPLIPH